MADRCGFYVTTPDSPKPLARYPLTRVGFNRALEHAIRQEASVDLRCSEAAAFVASIGIADCDSRGCHALPVTSETLRHDPLSDRDVRDVGIRLGSTPRRRAR